MVITETPRSLAISFIRVLMDGYSVYRTRVQRILTMTLAMGQVLFARARTGFMERRTL